MPSFTVPRPRSKRLVPSFPKGAERRYRAHIGKRVRAIASLVRRVVLPSIELGALSSVGVEEAVEATGLVRTDASPEALAALDLLRRTFDERVPPDEQFLASVAASVEGTVERETARMVVGTIPIPRPFDVAPFISQNVDLIKSIDQRFFTQIADIIDEAQANGWSLQRTTRELARATNAPLNRAKLIARDQVATLNSQITKEKQARLGIQQYRWSTSLDERVRPEHAEREGRVFDWDAPPPDGHPGEPINCRCVAIPVVEL